MQVLHLPTFNSAGVPSQNTLLHPPCQLGTSAVLHIRYSRVEGHSESHTALALVTVAVGALLMLAPSFTLSAMAGVVVVPWLLAACGDIELNPGPSTPAEELAKVEEQIRELEEEWRRVKALPVGDPERQRLGALEQNLAELRKEKNSLREAIQGNLSSRNQDQLLQQVISTMATMQQQAFNTMATIQQQACNTMGTIQRELLNTVQSVQLSILPVEIAASTADSAKANVALACCGIAVLNMSCDVPCCFGQLQLEELSSIKSMAWPRGTREDAPENMKLAQEALTTWVQDPELLVLDVHRLLFLSFNTLRAQLPGSTTDLVVVDKSLAARFLQPSALSQLCDGDGTVPILQAVAKAICAAYECKTTGAAQGQLQKFTPQCKVQFAALNIMAGVYGAGSDSACAEQSAETTVWCGDVNPGLTMGLHSRVHMDDDGRYPRVLHIMMPGPDCQAENAARVLAAFKCSLQNTKDVRRSLWGAAAVPPDGPAPNARQPSNPRDMDAEPAARQGGPATGSSDSRTAGTPPLQQGTASSTSLQPQADSATGDDVDDVPVDYHERIEFNLEVQDALFAALNEPSQLQGLGLTEAELREQVASVDACGWLSAVGRELAKALLQDQAPIQAAHASDVQLVDHGS